MSQRECSNIGKEKMTFLIVMELKENMNWKITTIEIEYMFPLFP